MVLGIWGVRLLGNLFTDKGVMRAGEYTVRAGQNFNMASSFS